MPDNPVSRKLVALASSAERGVSPSVSDLLPAFGRRGWKVRSCVDWRQWVVGLEHRQMRLAIATISGVDPRLFGRLATIKTIAPSARPIVLIICPSGNPSLQSMALEAGADLTLPEATAPDLVVAQVHALLRLIDPTQDSAQLRAGIMTLDLSLRLLSVSKGNDRRETTVSVTESRLMRALFNLAHRPQTREALVAAVWGSDSRIQARTIDVHVRRMRRALARIGCSEMLQTVRGIGYRFDPD